MAYRAEGAVRSVLEANARKDVAMVSEDTVSINHEKYEALKVVFSERTVRL